MSLLEPDIVALIQAPPSGYGAAKALWQDLERLCHMYSQARYT
jgi:hypothetical protein